MAPWNPSDEAYQQDNRDLDGNPDEPVSEPVSVDDLFAFVGRVERTIGTYLTFVEVRGIFRHDLAVLRDEARALLGEHGYTGR